MDRMTRMIPFSTTLAIDYVSHKSYHHQTDRIAREFTVLTDQQDDDMQSTGWDRHVEPSKHGENMQ